LSNNKIEIFIKEKEDKFKELENKWKKLDINYTFEY
jgi:hypothetical protein